MTDLSEAEQRQIRRVWANLSIERPELTIEQVEEAYRKMTKVEKAVNDNYWKMLREGW